MPRDGGAVLGHLAEVVRGEADQFGAEEIVDVGENLGMVHEVIDFGEFEMRRTEGKAAIASGHDLSQLLVKKGSVLGNLSVVENAKALEVAVAIESGDLFGSEGSGVVDGAGIEAQVAVHFAQFVVGRRGLEGVVNLVRHGVILPV